MTFSALHPAALWLLPPALALIILFRLLRGRRTTIEVGSLLIWQRLAAIKTPPRKKKFVVDASLILQALTLCALIAALTFPALFPAPKRGRTILLVIDNGITSRVRDENGVPLLRQLTAEASRVLSTLSADDSVFLARSAPFPTLLSATPLKPSDALPILAALTPALSAPDAQSIRAFALDRARTLRGDTKLQSLIISFQADSSRQHFSDNVHWLSPTNKKLDFNNVAIIASGSSDTVVNGAIARQVSVRVANFSDTPIRGTIVKQSKTSFISNLIDLPAGGEHAGVLDIPVDLTSPISIGWKPAHADPDSLPDDNSILLIPRAEQKPSVRFHTPFPLLEDFFRKALNASIVTTSDATPVDLDVYLNSVPDSLPATSRAALLIAPSRGYRSFFDVSDKLFTWPKAELGESDPLNADIPAGDSGIAIPKAYEILRTGDFKTLLQDAATQRPLALKFIDDRARPFYVLSFVPNDGLSQSRLLDPPLAAMLIRMLRQAAQVGPPFLEIKAADLELRSGQPLPLDGLQNATGVLDEHASNLRAVIASNAVDADSSKRFQVFLKPDSVQPAALLDLLPWLAAIAAVLVLAEIFWSRRTS